MSLIVHGTNMRGKLVLRSRGKSANMCRSAFSNWGERVVQIASYFPHLPGLRDDSAWTFAVSADDCELHFQRQALTPRQLADDKENKDIIGVLQMATQLLGRPADHTYLYEAFATAPYAAYLRRYQTMFASLPLDPISPAHVHFAPRDDFYAPLAEQGAPTEQVCIYLASGTNRRLHTSAETLGVSQRVNSKMQLARDALRAGLRVPETVILRKADLSTQVAADFIAAQGGSAMLKIMGLAGARNVTRIDSVAAATAFLEEFPEDLELLLQAPLDADRYTEMTVDLVVSDTDIQIANTRKLLFADGLWVGNYISEHLNLTAQQQADLLRVGEYVRQQGYSAAQGLNCGIDFFLDQHTGEVVVIEINARYTGGMIPAQVLKRLAVGARPAVVCFALVEVARFEDYMAFTERHLWRDDDAPFASVSLGFSPYPIDVEGQQMMLVWQLVIDDLAAFNRAKDAALGSANLAVTNQIEAVKDW